MEACGKALTVGGDVNDATAAHFKANMHYLIKQEKCEACYFGVNPLYISEPIRRDPRPALIPILIGADERITDAMCKTCQGRGYIETRVDADLWLREKLREFADEK